MEQILAYFKEYLGLSDKMLIDAIMHTAYIEHYEKGEILLHQGEIPEGICFLVSGVLRGYFLDKDGDDITDCFGYRLGTAAMPYADIAQASPITIEAMEPSDIFIIPLKTIQTLMESNFETVRTYNRLLLAGAAEHWEIKTAMYQYSALQRYIWFTKKYEGLIDLVPHKYVASFLGMSPVTLSRLRRSLKDK